MLQTSPRCVMCDVAILQASEYAEVGKVVAYVSVNDPDSGENGVTVCRLNTKDFELQPLNNQGQYKASRATD